MDLTPRVEALEQEVSVLKNEIKAILQEVRTAVLAHDNPFASASAAVPSSSHAASPQPAPRPVEEPEPAVLRPVPAADQDKPSPRALPSQLDTVSQAPLEAAAKQPGSGRRWSRQELATFMEWAQDVTARFGRKELAVMLGISRHGGLISPQLEETLLKLGETLGLAESKPASLSDFMLSLRELDALQGPGEPVTQPARLVA
jgi:hypothetical protein